MTLSLLRLKWRGFSAAFKERVREQQRRTNAAKEDAAAAAAAAVGGPCPAARPQCRNKATHGRSNRAKTGQAAPSPAMQLEKQPASRMPVEAPTAHRDAALSSRQHMQSCRHILLLSTANVRLLMTSVTVPPWNRQNSQSHRQRGRELRPGSTK